MDTNYRQLSSGLFVPSYIKEEKTHRISTTSLASYRRHLQNAGKAVSTIEKYTYEINNFIQWLGDRILTIRRVREWAEEQLKTRKAVTVNGALAALNGIFRWLGCIDCIMPFYKVQETPYRDDSRNITQEDFAALIKAADERMKAMMLTFRGTGIRVSELQFFTVESVREGRVTVRNKGKIREVFLDGDTRKMLLEYCSSAGIESGIVFRGRNGGPLHRNTIWHDMKVLARKAGVELSKVFPHNMRHLFAVERYRIEPDIEALRIDMGHSLITTTQRYLKKTIGEHWERIKRRESKYLPAVT